MPVNITANIDTITASTRRALRHSTGLKAATLSLMASIPVSAAHPELKARSSSMGPNTTRPLPWASSRSFCCSARGVVGSSPKPVFTAPATRSSITMAMKK